MKPIWSRIEIEAPLGEIWSLLTEPRFWPEWGPSVRSVHTDCSRIGLGTRGSIETPIGLRVPFEITRFEPEHFWDWSVAGIQATGHRLTALTPQRTRVEFSVPWPFAPYVVVLMLGLRRLKALAEAPSSVARSAPSGVSKT
jgi:hypothetical protein